MQELARIVVILLGDFLEEGVQPDRCHERQSVWGGEAVVNEAVLSRNPGQLLKLPGSSVK